VQFVAIEAAIAVTVQLLQGSGCVVDFLRRELTVLVGVQGDDYRRRRWGTEPTLRRPLPALGTPVSMLLLRPLSALGTSETMLRWRSPSALGTSEPTLRRPLPAFRGSEIMVRWRPHSVFGRAEITLWRPHSVVGGAGLPVGRLGRYGGSGQRHADRTGQNKCQNLHGIPPGALKKLDCGKVIRPDAASTAGGRLPGSGNGQQRRFSTSPAEFSRYFGPCGPLGAAGRLARKIAALRCML